MASNKTSVLGIRDLFSFDSQFGGGDGAGVNLFCYDSSSKEFADKYRNCAKGLFIFS